MNYEKFQSLIIKDYLNHCKAITQNIKGKESTMKFVDNTQKTLNRHILQQKMILLYIVK